MKLRIDKNEKVAQNYIYYYPNLHFIVERKKE